MMTVTDLAHLSPFSLTYNIPLPHATHIQSSHHAAKKLTGGLVNKTVSLTVKITPQSTKLTPRDLTVNLDRHVFGLSPSQGCFETAEYVRLEVHGSDMLSDKLLGYALVPVDDFDMDVEIERSYPLQCQAVDKSGNGPILLSTTMITVGWS